MIYFRRNAIKVPACINHFQAQVQLKSYSGDDLSGIGRARNKLFRGVGNV